MAGEVTTAPSGCPLPAGLPIATISGITPPCGNAHHPKNVQNCIDRLFVGA
jgi:hypothetical protein